MKFAALAASVLALAQGIHALPSASTYYATIRDGAGIGYAYTQGNCRAASTKDLSGNVWHYVDQTTVNDGTSNFLIPLLRRDDTQQFIPFFPGSSDFSNYRQDLMVAMVNYPLCSGCQVHQGFYQGWSSSRDNVVALIKKYLTGQYANYNIVIGGGSLGGALGALAFAEFTKNSSIGLASKTIKGFSAGEPRVGNFVFAKWFNGFTGASTSNVGTWIRITHGYDSIVRSPPTPQYAVGSEPSGNYQHQGTEIWEVDNPSNGNHPSASTTYICYNRSDQSENLDCSVNIGNSGNTGDHTTYAGYNGPIPWEAVTCGAQ